MYQAHYINPHFQFGKKNFELILEDDAGVLPTIRQWAKFNENVTDDEMITFAENIIDQVLAEQQL